MIKQRNYNRIYDIYVAILGQSLLTTTVCIRTNSKIICAILRTSTLKVGYIEKTGRVPNFEFDGRNSRLKTMKIHIFHFILYKGTKCIQPH